MEERPLTLLPPEELFPALEQLLQAGYDGEFTVTGNSMWPFLAHVRDRVTLRALGDRPLKRGDVVLFRPNEGRYLLHRVIGLEAEHFRAAGDGNTFCDGRFPRSCVVGRVVACWRKGRLVSCQTPACRLWGSLWALLFPVRRPLLNLLRTAARWRNMWI